MKTIISIIIGVLIFMLGLKIESEIVLIIGACFVVSGILFFLSAIAGYGKSEEEKAEIEKNMFDDFQQGVTSRARYDAEKRMMNDVYNKDMQKNIEKALGKMNKK